MTQNGKHSCLKNYFCTTAAITYTGHKDPEGVKSIAILFIEPRR